MEALVFLKTSRKVIAQSILLISCACVTVISNASESQDDTAVAPVLPSDPASLAARVGMKWVEDDFMSAHVAQGFADNVEYLENVMNQTVPTDEAPETALMTATQVVVPFLQLFTDYEMSGVEYDDPLADQVIFNEDETVTLILPDRIGEIAYRNFKARDSSGAALGDIYLNDIELFEGSQIILHKHRQ